MSKWRLVDSDLILRHHSEVEKLWDIILKRSQIQNEAEQRDAALNNVENHREY